MELLPLCRNEGPRFVAYLPLASGLLTLGNGKEGNALLDQLYGGEKVKRALGRFQRVRIGRRRRDYNWSKSERAGSE